MSQIHMQGPKLICAQPTLLGPVVRVAPNELSFNTAQSWKDIYEKKKGQGTFIKSDFYDGGNFAAEAPSIVSVRDPDEHANMRRYLRDAFSDRSLRDQEYLISEVIDRFVTRVGEEGKESSGIDIVTWLNLATFDSTLVPCSLMFMVEYFPIERFSTTISPSLTSFVTLY
jgi:cytochrome P450